MAKQLYAVACEVNMAPKLYYFHAEDAGDARVKLLRFWRTKSFGKAHVKVVAVGLSIGTISQIDNLDNLITHA